MISLTYFFRLVVLCIRLISCSQTGWSSNIRDIVAVCLAFKLTSASRSNIPWVPTNSRYLKGGLSSSMWCRIKNLSASSLSSADILVLFSFCMLGSLAIRSCRLCWSVYWYSNGIPITLTSVNMGKDLSASIASHVSSRVLFRFNAFRFGNCWGTSFGEMFSRGHSDIRNSTSPGKTNPIFPISSHCVMACLLIDKLLMFGYCSGQSGIHS